MFSSQKLFFVCRSCDKNSLYCCGPVWLQESPFLLESSPLKTCNVPTDMNFGITGAPLSAYHILHDKKIKLYSMRTFFYTSTAPCKKEAKGSRGLCFTLENPSSTFHQNPWSALRHLLNLVQEENSACMINDENDNFTGDDQEFLLTKMKSYSIEALPPEVKSTSVNLQSS